MKTTEYIQLKIDRLPKGYVFTYEDFINEVNKKEAVIKSLNRMTASNVINKISKGKFYKPEGTAFGTLPPEKKQIVKDLLEKDGKLIGYITGYSVYNQLGLTTQISKSIQIGRNDFKPTIQRGIYAIFFIRQKNTITKENVPLLQILDAIRDIRYIPDTSTSSAVDKMITIIKSLDTNKQIMLTKLVMKYPPATRALSGAILEYIEEKELAILLQKSLDPITIYGLFNIDSNTLPTAYNWNIK